MNTSTRSIRTRTPVIIDPIRQVLAVVYIKIVNIVYSEKGYAATAEYSRFLETEDEYGEPTTAKVVLNRDSIQFSIAEAQQMEVLLGVTGTTVSERLADIIPKLTMYQAGVSQVFGLGPEDFEEVEDVIA
jgi:hypothetical protein